MMELRPIAHDDVRPYASRAAKEHVSLSEGATPTDWWGVFDGGRLVAFAGLLPLRNGYRFRGAYTLPGERGKGYGTMLLTGLIDRVAPARIEAIALDPRIYDRLGFRRASESRTRSGTTVTRVILEGRRHVW
ncbi:MAG: hypothetical protein C0498_01480 [Anaerolinea sp.]|nr:hypothetical protein [Anaerolinea sp.]